MSHFATFFLNCWIMFASVNGNTQWNYYLGLAEVGAGAIAKVAGETLQRSGGWWGPVGIVLSVVGDLLIQDGTNRVQQPAP